MKILLNSTYYILRTTFPIALIAYFLLLILNILTEDFVAYYINFTAWLWVLIIMGVLILWLGRKTK
jgi:hypothetical protein